MSHKAGMGDVDKDRIQKLINDASKGSDYYIREFKRSDDARAKAIELIKKIEIHKRNEKLWKND